MVVKVKFSLVDQDAKTHTEADYAGKYLVMYFYPKDDTPGCIREACAYRDLVSELKKLGAEVVGVSKDSAESHGRFAGKFRLNFPLLVDEGGKLAKFMGAWGEKKLLGKSWQGVKRNTYLIDPSGEVVKSWEDVDPVAHVREVMAEIATRTSR